ncbi:hypothetical protein [Marinobacter salarius]|uniref:Uncharacterized protein n=1 Tax=Marinobacter salarius TaxID=1420917 RepID=A0A1W6KG50_9GAMM|nr:hypothetical protein [Marinobacter salarius]ARM86302.1 hypothetical protein MARSALSMR5_04285 [Marinobacter salarius]
MQRDPAKLTAARVRRAIANALLLCIAFWLVEYALFLASGGRHNMVFDLGHWNLAGAALFAVSWWLVLRPVSRLEFPYMTHKDHDRKARQARQARLKVAHR